MTDSNQTHGANPFLLPNKAYNVLKQIALVFLPAFSTLYFTLGTAWEWPEVAKVVGSIAAVNTFLGAMLGVSTRVYNHSEAKYDGVIHSVVAETGVKTFTLELNMDPETIDEQGSILFKVEPLGS